MDPQSRFLLVDDRFVMVDNSLVLTIQDPLYAAPILERIRWVEKQYDPQTALQFAEKLEGLLPSKIAKPNDSSALMFAIQKRTQEKAKIMGERLHCKECKRKYWTRNIPNALCPVCNPPVLAAVPQAKQGE